MIKKSAHLNSGRIKKNSAFIHIPKLSNGYSHHSCLIWTGLRNETWRSNGVNLNTAMVSTTHMEDTRTEGIFLALGLDTQHWAGTRLPLLVDQWIHMNVNQRSHFIVIATLCHANWISTQQTGRGGFCYWGLVFSHHDTIFSCAVSRVLMVSRDLVHWENVSSPVVSDVRVLCVLYTHN